MERQFRERLFTDAEPTLFAVGSDEEATLTASMARTSMTAATATNLCGACREFVEDLEGGRGTCLHPGSGVLSPWTDTQACSFFSRARVRPSG